MLLTCNSPQSRSQCPQQRVGKSEVSRAWPLLLYRPVCESAFYLSALRISSYLSPYGMLSVPTPPRAINEPIANCSAASVIFSARILAPLKHTCQRFVTRCPRTLLRQLTLENPFSE